MSAEHDVGASAIMELRGLSYPHAYSSSNVQLTGESSTSREIIARNYKSVDNEAKQAHRSNNFVHTNSSYPRDFTTNNYGAKGGYDETRKSQIPCQANENVKTSDDLKSKSNSNPHHDFVRNDIIMSNTEANVGLQADKDDTSDNKTNRMSTWSLSSTQYFFINPYNVRNYRFTRKFRLQGWMTYVFLCFYPGVKYMESSDYLYMHGQHEQSKVYADRSTVLFGVGALLMVTLVAFILFFIVYFSI